MGTLGKNMSHNRRKCLKALKSEPTFNPMVRGFDSPAAYHSITSTPTRTMMETEPAEDSAVSDGKSPHGPRSPRSAQATSTRALIVGGNQAAAWRPAQLEIAPASGFD